MPSRQELLHAYIQSGLRQHAQGDVGAAKSAYEQALAVAPDSADALNLLGAALLQLGRPEEALDCLQRAARKLKDNAGLIGNLAQAYFALGRYDESREAFRKASRIEPREAQFQLGVATSLALQGKLDEAETILRRAASRFPENALVWFNLGNLMRDRQRPAEAIEHCHRALELNPQFIDARNNLGGILQALLRFEEAEREYRMCIQLAPDYLPGRCNLASVLIDQGRFVDAENSCRELIRIDPNFEQGHTMLGAALGHQGRAIEALECHRTASKLAPEDPKVARIFASALAETGHFSEGLRWFSRALELNTDPTSLRQMLGSALLAHGCLADGWVEYGSRPALRRFREKYPDITLARALPDDLDGKHICVLREQGLGDEIFFLRYAPQLRASGAKITYRASSKLKSIFGRLDCLAEVLAETAPLPAADAVMLVGDLPHALGMRPLTELPNLPLAPAESSRRELSRRISVFWPRVPRSVTLSPLDEDLAKVENRLAGAGPPPYLGITWRGGTPPVEQQGSVSWLLYKEIGIPPLAQALRAFPGTFIALQRNPVGGELDAFSNAVGRRIHDFTDLNEDLEGMLALLALIDEYAGVSNTNMHLRAGAGKAARVLVPCPAEWRWMAAGRESPWFPGFSIYRQSLRGDWAAALGRLHADLTSTYDAHGNRR